jgi:hypothetical protein
MATIGIDIASIDGNSTPDWTKARTAGHLQFVGLRAVEGLSPDVWYPIYRRQLDAISMPNFPYLIMTPGLATPEAQAKMVLNIVGTLDRCLGRSRRGTAACGEDLGMDGGVLGPEPRDLERERLVALEQGWKTYCRCLWHDGNLSWRFPVSLQRFIGPHARRNPDYTAVSSARTSRRAAAPGACPAVSR